MHEPRPRLSEADLAEIESLARTDTAEPYRGPPLALVDEVRRLQGVIRSSGLVDGTPDGIHYEIAGRKAASDRG